MGWQRFRHHLVTELNWCFLTYWNLWQPLSTPKSCLHLFSPTTPSSAKFLPSQWTGSFLSKTDPCIQILASTLPMPLPLVFSPLLLCWMFPLSIGYGRHSCLSQLLPPPQSLACYFLLAFVVVQLLSHVWPFATLWTATCQTSLSFTVFQSLLKLMSIELVMPSNRLILCLPLHLLPQSFPASESFSMSCTSHKLAKGLELQLQHQSF